MLKTFSILGLLLVSLSAKADKYSCYHGWHGDQTEESMLNQLHNEHPSFVADIQADKLVIGGTSYPMVVYSKAVLGGKLSFEDTYYPIPDEPRFYISVLYTFESKYRKGDLRFIYGSRQDSSASADPEKQDFYCARQGLKK